MPLCVVDAMERLDRGPCGKRGRARSRTGARELVVRRGQDDRAVFAIRADLVEGLRQLAMGQKPPAQRLAVGMKGHLQYTVSALHPRRLVLVRVLVECAHLDLPMSGLA